MPGSVATESPRRLRFMGIMPTNHLLFSLRVLRPQRLLMAATFGIGGVAYVCRQRGDAADIINLRPILHQLMSNAAPRRDRLPRFQAVAKVGSKIRRRIWTSITGRSGGADAQ
jgi:hypothetical protein